MAVGRETAEDGIGESLAQAAHDLVVILLRKRADVDREGLRQRHHDLGGQRTLVVLDLIEIAGRNTKTLGESALVQASGFAQLADLWADEDLLAHKDL